MTFSWKEPQCKMFDTATYTKTETVDRSLLGHSGDWLGDYNESGSCKITFKKNYKPPIVYYLDFNN